MIKGSLPWWLIGATHCVAQALNVYTEVEHLPPTSRTTSGTCLRLQAWMHSPMFSTSPAGSRGFLLWWLIRATHCVAQVLNADMPCFQIEERDTLFHVISISNMIKGPRLVC